MRPSSVAHQLDAHRPDGLRARSGHTLVELVVSVLVLAVGLLALTGASAVVARQLNGGAQLALAATVAQSRFETMRSRDCATLESGASEHRGITERWSVVRIGRTVEVTDTVWIEGRHTRRMHTLRTSIPCPHSS